MSTANAKQEEQSDLSLVYNSLKAYLNKKVGYNLQCSCNEQSEASVMFLGVDTDSRD